MTLRKIYLAIFLSSISLQIKAQMLPITGMPNIPSQLLMRPNYTGNNVLPQGASNSSKRNVTYSGQQKKLRDSLITARINPDITDEIDTAIVNLRKKIFGFSIFNNNLAFLLNLRFDVFLLDDLLLDDLFLDDLLLDDLLLDDLLLDNLL